jgi:hypothetical protein
MKYFIILAFVFFQALQKTHAQDNDSTANFKTYPLETVAISSWSVLDENINDTVKSGSSSERSSLLILDKELRHCYITAKLIEYRNGIKIREATVLSKEAIYNSQEIASFEDSSFVFSLYRKPQKDNQSIWGFRTPSTIRFEKVEMPDPENYWPYITDLQDHKLPIGKPFVFLLITTPDGLKDLPFFKTGNKNNYRTPGGNKGFELRHSFIIELTIEKSQDFGKNTQTLKA